MTWTRERKNEWQREYRKRTRDSCTRKYEKTKPGFLMRLYRNMQSRVTGVQKIKHHLYEGVNLTVTRTEFYKWAESNDAFHALWDEWVNSGYEMKLTPSVDRIDSSGDYVFDNMEWVTHSENSRRGAISDKRKK